MKSRNIDYKAVKPLAFPTKMTVNRFQPQGNLNQFSINDSIRWVINGKSYWDRIIFYNLFYI